MAQVTFGCGDYTVSATVGELSPIHDLLLQRATLQDDFGAEDAEGTPFVVTIMRSGADWPDMVISQRFSPGPSSGFHPGVLLIPENHILLLGAGTRLLAYDLRARRRLWEDQTGIGFWGWSRHGDIVLMSSELELAAWDTHARKLWSTFVEPPWTYAVAKGVVELDVMGAKSAFSIESGPAGGCAG